MLMHESDNLVGYIDGGLDSEARRRVERHLETCHRCRAELAEMRAARHALESIGHGTPVPAFDTELWSRVRAQIAPAHQGYAAHPAYPVARLRPRWALATGAFALTAATACLIFIADHQSPNKMVADGDAAIQATRPGATVSEAERPNRLDSGLKPSPRSQKSPSAPEPSRGDTAFGNATPGTSRNFAMKPETVPAPAYPAPARIRSTKSITPIAVPPGSESRLNTGEALGRSNGNSDASRLSQPDERRVKLARGEHAGGRNYFTTDTPVERMRAAGPASSGAPAPAGASGSAIDAPPMVAPAPVTAPPGAPAVNNVNGDHTVLSEKVIGGLASRELGTAYVASPTDAGAATTWNASPTQGKTGTAADAIVSRGTTTTLNAAVPAPPKSKPSVKSSGGINQDLDRMGLNYRDTNGPTRAGSEAMADAKIAALPPNALEIVAPPPYDSVSGVTLGIKATTVRPPTLIAKDSPHARPEGRAEATVAPTYRPATAEGRRAFAMAGAALAAGRRSEAFGGYRKALEAGVTLTEARIAHLRLGDAAILAKDDAAALKEFTAALEIAKDTEVLTKVGGVYERMGETAKAMNAYQQALMFQQGNVEARAGLARLKARSK